MSRWATLAAILLAPAAAIAQEVPREPMRLEGRREGAEGGAGAGDAAGDGGAGAIQGEGGPHEDADDADAGRQGGDHDAWADDLDAGEVLVIGEAEEVFRAGGSAHAIGEEELGRLSSNDPMAVLARVPGVYVRSEEGYGLRPNIGLRGASSERSRKITLMEDGVLLAPAPYSAPAAYYFPMMARMVGVEVFAGPAAIPFGPNTIGGAIDLAGRPIPARREGRVDLALGNTWYGRAHFHYGDSNEWGGFLVEALHLRTSGFHELDAAPGTDTDTGFHRTDVLARGEIHGELDRDFYHRLELTFGLGLEQSNETYLGTTDADFRAAPYRRYAATQLDRMEWWRTRVQLRYEIRNAGSFRLAVTAYRHDLDRTWYRLDHFCDQLVDRPAGEADTCAATVGFDRVLADPWRYASRYERLTGTLEPEPGDAPLLVARNHRVFAAQGIQANGSGSFATGPLTHRVAFGARLHFDEITRIHTGDTYFLRQRQMVLETAGLDLERNHDSAWALSTYVSWAVTWDHLTIAPGLRTELVWMRHDDRFTQDAIDGEQYALLPGVGAQYELTRDLALFAGAHLGFSPVAPGQGPEVLPETAWNYEVGARYGRITDPTHGQLTYFVSDYQNLSSTCTLASGCEAGALDRMSNAGAALITGIEAEVAHTIGVEDIAIPIAVGYTWTYTRFATSFQSDNPQLGSVEIGDHMPYVPEHQLSVRAGVSWCVLEIHASASYVSAMRDVAGQGPARAEELTDEALLLDAMASLEVLPGVRLYVRGENLTDARPILTRRAWGARGARPVLVQGGLQIDIR